MTHDEAVNILKNYQLWRRGKPPYDFPVEMPFTPKELGESIDHAIAELERLAASGKAIDHFRGVTKKVQNTDSVEGITQFDERVAKIELDADCYRDDFGSGLKSSLSLIREMQTHIRKLEEEKRSNDEQWRLQLANLRLQIYKLERENLQLSDMVDSLMDILRELVELRHIKTTQGKTPEYLERQPKAWARAEEAVK